LTTWFPCKQREADHRAKEARGGGQIRPCEEHSDAAIRNLTGKPGSELEPGLRKDGLACQAPTLEGAGSGGGGEGQAGVGAEAMLNPINNFPEVEGGVDEVKELAVDRQDGAFGVFSRPLLVVAVEQAQVVRVDRVLN